MNEFQVIQNGTQASILLGKKLVSDNITEVKNEMKRLLNEGVNDMIVDCDRLVFIDSSGIGCLVAAYNSLSKLTGKLSIIQVSSDIHELLCSMRLERRIHIETKTDSSE